jgi:prepilin-type N-terminal cleavage/methylation domain-containing protein
MKKISAQAFTLLEMIAVMTVIAILAGVLAPSMIRQIQSASAAGEDQNLSTIAQGILDYIRANQTLPDTNPASTNWAGQVSSFTSLSPDKNLYVFPGQGSSRRVLLYDPAFLNWGNLQQTNVWQANSKPSPARILLVSSSSPDPNLNVTSLTSADFTNLFNWNKAYSNGVINSPSSLPTAWQRKGEYLHIKTIDLGPFFCQINFRDCYAPIASITNQNVGSAYTNSPQFIFTNQGSLYQVNCNTNNGEITFVSLISAAGFNNTNYDTNIPVPFGTNGRFVNQPPIRGMISFNNTNAAFVPDQISTNIVLRGTKLYLRGVQAFDQAFEIQKDCEFEFFNQTWTQKY